MYSPNRPPGVTVPPSDKTSPLSPGPPPPAPERLLPPSSLTPARPLHALHAIARLPGYNPMLRADSVQTSSLQTMCAPNHNALLAYAGLKVPAPSPYFALNPAAGQLSALDFHRSQFCDYRQLLGLRQYQALHASGLGPYAAAYLDPYTQYLYKGDPRARFVQEEPKPSHSYIGLIAMAILGSKEKKLVLSDIYQWILDNYPYFRTRGPGWRNSIRHNLSLNDCFIKSGRSANGKGHFWAVHPANVDDFSRGDFRRRRAQRKVRKHMGLSVPDDDEDSPSPSPNPISWGAGTQDPVKDAGDDFDNNNVASDGEGERGMVGMGAGEGEGEVQAHAFMPLAGRAGHISKKRLFDMDSLLAPDYPVVVVPKVRLLTSTASSNTAHSDMDSVTSDQRQGCHSDESDVDIEGEDGENDHLDDVDRDSEMVGDDLHHQHPPHPSLSEDSRLSPNNVDIKTEDPADSSEPPITSQGVQTSTSSPLSSPPPLPSSSESSSSALDLSSSSLPPSALTSMSVMSSEATRTTMSMMTTGPLQPVVLPRALDNGQRGRWLGLGMGLGGPGLAPGPCAELGLRRYSAFHAAGGGANPQFRASLTSSVPPFLHPVFAASRYPALLSLNPSTSSSQAPSVALASSEPRVCVDDASQDSPVAERA